MLSFFFQCICCRSGIRLSRDTFPLCTDCESALVDSPLLCPSCGSPACSPAMCLHPWRRRDSVRSYSARYLLLGHGYTVLKKWKIHGGTWFSEKILTPHPALFDFWEKIRPQAIIPIPQSFRRMWKMRGSRAEQIAQWVSGVTHAPLLPLLDIHRGSRLRQAEMDILGRMQSRIRFTVREPELKRFGLEAKFGLVSKTENNPGSVSGSPSTIESCLVPHQNLSRVILVDDFMTTGRTLHLAAEALYGAGIEEVHCFCLGTKAQRGTKFQKTILKYHSERLSGVQVE